MMEESRSRLKAARINEKYGRTYQEKNKKGRNGTSDPVTPTRQERTTLQLFPNFIIHVTKALHLYLPRPFMIETLRSDLDALQISNHTIFASGREFEILVERYVLAVTKRQTCHRLFIFTLY